MNSLKDIRNIIFDLGGVILNIDYQRTEDAFKELGMTHFGQEYSQKQQSNFFDQFETGQMDIPTFLETLRKQCPMAQSDYDVIAAWNAMLLDLPLRRLQLLQQLQIHFNTFLLSNTNELHEQAFNKTLQAQCGHTHFGFFFDRVYYSHRVGLRKPNKEVFELILEQNNLKPEQTLFLDDSLQHVDSARSLGLQVIHLHAGMSMEKDIFKAKQ